jgi:L-iditol 2-dehydrogenase
MSFDEIAMLEPMAVGVYAIDLSLMKSTDNILVMGAGAIGLSVIQAAKAHGAAQIIVSEPVKERRELALKLGATDAVDPGSSDAVADVHALTNNRGVDIAFECTGAEQSTVDASRMVKVLGKVMVIGIPDEDFYHFDASSSRRKELTVVFVRRSNLTTERSMELVAENKIDIASYATHRFPLDKVGEAMETMISKRDGVVRAVIAVSD